MMRMASIQALHSNMFLLIPRAGDDYETPHPALHSNMFLLIRGRGQ